MSDQDKSTCTRPLTTTLTHIFLSYVWVSFQSVADVPKQISVTREVLAILVNCQFDFEG